MSNFFNRFLLSPQDVGIEKYSTEEIAEIMKPSETEDSESLMEFACAVREIFEDDDCLD